MREEVSAFLGQIPEWQNRTAGDLIPHFVYFLTVVKELEAATAAQIGQCFDDARLKSYSNIPAFLSRNATRKKGKRPLFIRTHAGYQLERVHEEDIGKTLQTEPARQEASQALTDLLKQLVDRDEKEFLQEAIDCYAVDARRAAIVMVWILTIHHLYKHILKKKLMEFNGALAKVTDRRVKVTVITSIDDFSDIPEAIFLDIARAAKIISNDVFKILGVKLGIRNSYAHPSAVLISQVKTTDFIIDLTQNVILKYKI
jgi:hypothetical protein